MTYSALGVAGLAAVLVLSGCDDAVEPDAGSSDAGESTDAGDSTDAGPDASVGGCSADNLPACEYQPETMYGPGAESEREVTYTDEAGLERTLAIELRLTDAGARPAPLVIWSHGGASGQIDPTDVATGFSGVFRSAGYAVIGIAHTPRDRDAYARLCRAVGFSDCAARCTVDSECSSGGAPGVCNDGGCRFWKHLNWDRPHDLARVIDWVEAMTASGMPLEGLIDPTRIVYAGHSAGGGASMMVAGATRDFAGTQRLLMDPRPMAFISCSPQGPGDDDFIEASFMGETCRAMATDPALCLTRPHLSLTGFGDDTGVVAENRRLSFDLAPMTGQRHLGWLMDEAARHTTFDYDTAACVRHSTDMSLDPARCDTHLVWLRSAALSFLDAYVRDSATARAYLVSSNLATLSAADFDFETR